MLEAIHILRFKGYVEFNDIVPPLHHSEHVELILIVNNGLHIILFFSSHQHPVGSVSLPIALLIGIPNRALLSPPSSSGSGSPPGSLVVVGGDLGLNNSRIIPNALVSIIGFFFFTFTDKTISCVNGIVLHVSHIAVEESIDDSI